jgi:hypothetical protein
MSKPLPPEKRLEWEEKIRKQQESGLSMEKWCNQHQIPSHRFYYWKERLFPKPPLNRSCFAELPDSKNTGIAIEYRGLQIRLDKHFDSAALKRCLSALMEIKC